MNYGAIFTYLVTGFGCLAGLFSPFYGLLAYICLAIVQPTSMWYWVFPPGTSHARYVALAMLIGWAGRGFGTWKFGRGASCIAVLLAYWIWMALSSLQAIDASKGAEIVKFYAKIILPLLVGLTTVKSMREVKLLAWVLVLSQGYLAFELNVSFYTETHRNRVVDEGFGGMDNNTVAIAMVTGVGLAFFLGMGERRWWLKGLAFLSAALMGHVILFSYSRGGMLALIVTGAVAFVLIPKGPKHYLALLIAIALMVRLAGPQVRERFFSSFEKSEVSGLEASAQSRLDLWRDALDATLRHPILGVGPDNWGLVAPYYGWKEGKEVHSYWMQTAAELGVPGLLVLAAFYLLCIVKLWPLTSEKTPVRHPWSHDAARMVIAALIGFCFASQFVTIKFMEVQFYVALVGLAVLRLETGHEVTGRVPCWGRGIRRRTAGA